MAALLKKFEAAEKLQESCKQLPSFESLRARQCKKLEIAVFQGASHVLQ